MRGLNLDQLRALLEVVEQGSFSAAARRLNLTQPAVSLQIRELERRFGLRLIERLGKQAHATAPGSELVEATKRIFQECERADAAMQRFRNGWAGRVQVATTLTAMIYRLPPILRRVRLEHPSLDLIVTNMPSEKGVQDVIENRVDLALVHLPVSKRQLEVTPLFSEMMVAIFPADMRDVPDEISPSDVAEHNLLVEQTTSAGYSLVVGWLSERESGREPTPLGTVEALKSAVNANLGVAIVPDIAVAMHQSDFIIRPLNPPLSRTLALVEHRNKPNEPGLEIVRNALLALRGPLAPTKATRQSRSGGRL
ncbi:Transcriptional regulator, LysR-family [Bradyrhizobium sp. ORS 375]|uniref:LysR family transcriptional regulator n=1 Tax=Bradyrhizobium sp. (strain ORS 375) TaxID=566679 RepID=UPI00024058F3|nr:LysR family transcriptional regulator [Bradyrhizobium sp. ORS 375]CCD94543.1 Transcriptional regulator, LysR-family [Bradyrhizobium sp. ORS 375]